MQHETNPSGDLVISVAQPEQFEGPRHKDTVLALATAALENHNTKKSLDEARIDELTGFPNATAYEEFADSIRHSDPGEYSVIVVDLDNLKQTNDTMSHQFGNEYIKTVAATLQKSIRKTDRIFRTGGDEFVIILDRKHDKEDPIYEEETPNRSARGPVDRIRQTVAESIGAHPQLRERVGLGVSVGMATIQENETIHDAHLAADIEMYDDKTQKKSITELETVPHPEVIDTNNFYSNLGIWISEGPLKEHSLQYQAMEQSGLGEVFKVLIKQYPGITSRIGFIYSRISRLQNELRSSGENDKHALQAELTALEDKFKPEIPILVGCAYEISKKLAQTEGVDTSFLVA